jgi:hypothetical protein
MGSLGIGIMNSTVFSLSSKCNSKINENQITFGAIDFQPHPPTLAPVFANLDQEMDLMIEILNFRVGSLGSVRLSDLINLGPSVGKTAFVANLETSVGSSNEAISPVSIKPMKSKGNTVKELYKIIENLDLEESSNYSDMASDRKFGSSNYSEKISCSTMIKSQMNPQTHGRQGWNSMTMSKQSSRVPAVVSTTSIRCLPSSDMSKELNDNNPIINPANIRRGAYHMVEGVTADSIANKA